jgi:NosR/NirI family transcriptional regulator, nitrous oxide reductase regulator
MVSNTEASVDRDFLRPVIALGGVLVVGIFVIAMSLPAAPVEPDTIYTGTAEGYYDDLTVEVGIADGRIVSIRVQHSDTPGFADSAIDTTIERIIAAQSTEVDAVAGATGTSKGVIQAVAKALAEAGW